MTINKAKNLAAEKHGYYDWEAFLRQTMNNHPEINKVTTTAMKIYSENNKHKV
jgi:hypothetical protein